MFATSIQGDDTDPPYNNTLEAEQNTIAKLNFNIKISFWTGSYSILHLKDKWYFTKQTIEILCLNLPKTIFYIQKKEFEDAKGKVRNR